MLKRLGYIVLICMLAGLALNLCACGKKALPKPPRYVEPPMVGNLTVADIENDVLTLSWTLNGDRDELNVRAFRVYMAQDAIATLCLECPPNFASIGEAVALIDDGDAYMFQVRISEGFHYIFKVNAVGRENREGRDSNYAVYQYDAVQTKDE